MFPYPEPADLCATLAGEQLTASIALNATNGIDSRPDRKKYPWGDRHFLAQFNKRPTQAVAVDQAAVANSVAVFQSQLSQIATIPTQLHLSQQSNRSLPDPINLLRLLRQAAAFDTGFHQLVGNSPER